MEAPFTNPFGNKPVKGEQAGEELKSYPEERIQHVADPALQKMMTQTIEQLAGKKPFLAKFVTHSHALEDNFFRLMDTVHFLAKVAEKDKEAQGDTEQEKLQWECKNLLKIANQLRLPEKHGDIPSFIAQFEHADLDFADYKTALELVDHLPPDLSRFSLVRRLIEQFADQDFDFCLELAKRFSPDERYIFLNGNFLSQLVRYQNYEEVADFAESLPERFRSHVYISIAEDVMIEASFEDAKKYIEPINPEHVNLHDWIFPLALDNLSLEDILYIANKSCKRELYLHEIANFLAAKGQKEKMVQVYDAIKPGTVRDNWLHKEVNIFLKNNYRIDIWSLWAMTELISDKNIKLEVEESIKKRDDPSPLPKIR